MASTTTITNVFSALKKVLFVLFCFVFKLPEISVKYLVPGLTSLCTAVFE